MLGQGGQRDALCSCGVVGKQLAVNTEAAKRFYGSRYVFKAAIMSIWRDVEAVEEEEGVRLAVVKVVSNRTLSAMLVTAIGSRLGPLSSEHTLTLY